MHLKTHTQTIWKHNCPPVSRCYSMPLSYLTTQHHKNTTKTQNKKQQSPLNSMFILKLRLAWKEKKFTSPSGRGPWQKFLLLIANAGSDVFFHAIEHFHCMVEPWLGHVWCRKLMVAQPRVHGAYQNCWISMSPMFECAGLKNVLSMSILFCLCGTATREI